MRAVLVRMAGVLSTAAFLATVPASPPWFREPAPVKVRHAALAVPRSGASRAVVDPPFPFRLVGVSWERARDAGPVEVRVRGPRGWTPWVRLEADPWEGPDQGAREARHAATAPLWVGRGDRVEVRGVRGAAVVHVIDPGTGPARPPTPAAAQPATPPIVTRGEWGADESLRRAPPRYAPAVRFAVVHHTATSNGYGPGDSAAIVRSIYAYHVQANGWDDIGYNFLIDRFGRVFEGRAGGVDRAVIGAHAAGFNAGSTGVAIIGTFSTAEPPPEAARALRELLAWKLDLDHVDPQGWLTYRSGGSPRYPAGTEVTLPTIAGHRDLGNTECPGDGIYATLASVRRDAAAIGLPKLYEPQTDRLAFTPNGDGVADTVTASARGAAVARYRAEVVDAAGAVRRTASGDGSSPSFVWDGRDASGVSLGQGWYTVRLQAWDGEGGTATPAHLRVLLAAWPNGAIVRGSGPAVYRVRDGTLEHVASPATFASWYRWNEVARVPDAVLEAYRREGRLGFRDGSLVRTPDGYVWLISDGRRRHIQSPADFEGLGLRWDAIVDVSFEEAALHPLGDPVTAATLPLPNGMLVRGSGPAVYWIQGGLLRHVPSPSIFETWFRWVEVASVSDTRLTLPPGPPLPFRDGTLVRAEGDPAVYVISDGLRRHITSPATFESLGFAWENVRVASPSDLATSPPGQPV